MAARRMPMDGDDDQVSGVTRHMSTTPGDVGGYPTATDAEGTGIDRSQVQDQSLFSGTYAPYGRAGHAGGGVSPYR